MLVDRLLWRVIPDIKTTVGNTDFQFFPCMHLVCLLIRQTNQVDAGEKVKIRGSDGCFYVRDDTPQ